MSSTPSPKTSLAKLVLYPKPKPFKVMVLGQSGVGKSALVVRFITRRFIGEYDPNLEKIYSFQTVMDNEMVCFEILDSAGETQILEINVIRLIKRLFYMQVPNKRPAKPFIGEASQESEYANLETNIRWAEAFILMYSVTDKCSFDECHRLKFLINYNKRRRRLASTMKDSVLEMPPVVMVGNKADQLGDRMVFTDEGKRLSKEIGCVCFHEISVRESIEQVWGVFRDARRFWRVSKWSSGRSEDARIALSRPLGPASSDSTGTATAPVPFCRRWTELEVEEEALVAEVGGGFGRNDSTSSSGRSEGEEFRARASTDSRLPPRPARERHPPPSPAPPSHAGTAAHTTARRCSVAMRGDSAPSY